MAPWVRQGLGMTPRWAAQVVAWGKARRVGVVAAPVRPPHNNNNGRRVAGPLAAHAAVAAAVAAVVVVVAARL